MFIGIIDQWSEFGPCRFYGNAENAKNLAFVLDIEKFDQ